MMQYLLDLLDYNRWANDLLFKSIDESFIDHETPNSFNTIRKTIYHIWGAEELWLKRVRGNSTPIWTSQNFSGTFAEALSHMQAINNTWIEHIEGAADIEAIIDYKNVAGVVYSSRLDHIVAHVCNHSTFHRGQVVTMLRALGVTQIPFTDLIAYYRR